MRQKSSSNEANISTRRFRLTHEGENEYADDLNREK